jgi:hypothetical protein
VASAVAPTAQVAATSAAPAVNAAATAAVGTVTSLRANANSATVDEMTRAFETAGIQNANRWAREVEEYRPYPTNDASFAKLRGELAKYNPSPDTLARILATLSL